MLILADKLLQFAKPVSGFLIQRLCEQRGPLFRDQVGILGLWLVQTGLPIDTYVGAQTSYVSKEENVDGIGDFQHDMTCLEVSSVSPLCIYQLFTTQILDSSASGNVDEGDR